MKRVLIFSFLITTTLLLSCSSDSTKPAINHCKNDTVFITNTEYSKDSIITKERYFDKLSYKNDFKLTFHENYLNGEATEHHWLIEVFNKKTKSKTDSIIQPLFVFSANALNFNDTRSYITGENANAQVVDNYYGDFVVADLNFDSLNDFAIINDIGGTGGAFYSFFIQQKDGKFRQDPFLTDSMMYFPSKILPSSKQLRTYVISGVCGLGKHTYSFHQQKNNWSETSYKLINVCK